MAAKRVNRTLFIGMGGQGQIALAAVKQRLLDAYGSVPPMVGFLEIDADVLNEELKDLLSPREFFSISFNGALGVLDDRKKHLSKWFDSERIPRPSVANCTKGCGQIPQIGRLLLQFHMSDILKKVESALDATSAAQVIKLTGWEFGDAKPQIIFFSSIAGGTGSGTVLDLACAVRSNLTGETWDHNAFLVMPGVFGKSGRPGTHYVEENGYAFLKQLDFMLTHAGEISSGRYGDLFHVETLGGAIYDMVDPFDSITLVGDTNQGATPVNFKDPEDLAQAVGEIIYLLTCSGVGTALVSSLNNQPNFSIPWDGGKRCWYAGMGVAVMRFPKETFHEWARSIYIDKLVEKLRSGDSAPGEADGGALADDFLNGPPALREMGPEQNQIIDAIKLGTPFAPQVPKTVANVGQVEEVWQTNEAALTARVSDMASSANESFAGLLGASREALERRLEEIIRTQGSQVAMDFVTHLAGYFEAVAGEMKAEKARCTADAQLYHGAVAAAKNRCIEGLGKLFGKKAEIEKALADLRGALANLAFAKGGAIRRENAELLCHSLGVTLGELRTALEGRAAALNDLVERAATETAAAEMGMDREGNAESVIAVRPSRDELRLPAPEPAHFYGWFRERTGSTATAFWGMNVKDAWPLLVEYAVAQDVTRSMGQLDLVATLREWPSERRTERAKTVNLLAAPLLEVEQGKVGARPDTDATSSYFIYAAHDDFVSSFDSPPLDQLLHVQGVHDVMHRPIDSRDAAYFFRHWGCVPAYALTEFPGMRSEYLRHSRDPLRWSLHLDKRWLDRLDDLDPTSGTDTSDWVWSLASSDIDYLCRVRKAGTTHWLTFERDVNGEMVPKEVNLGQGVATARDAFFADRDYVEQCRERIEAAIIAKGNEVVLSDLSTYMGRLKVLLGQVDEARKPLVDKDIYALAGYIQSLR